MVHIGFRSLLCARFDIRVSARGMAIWFGGSRLDDRCFASLVEGAGSLGQFPQLAQKRFYGRRAVFGLRRWFSASRNLRPVAN